MSARRNNSSGLAICGIMSAIVAVFVSGCFVHDRAEDPGAKRNEEDLKTTKKQNIDALVKLEKLTENEDKFIATRYRLKLIEPIPLRQLLESDIVPEILAIGATVKFQIISAEEAKKWNAKFGASPAIVVTATQGEFTFKDEIVFTVYFPAAAS